MIVETEVEQSQGGITRYSNHILLDSKSYPKKI